MFTSPVELVTFAASNHLFVFGFCNFIIAVLFITSSKTTSNDVQDCVVNFQAITDEYNETEVEKLNNDGLSSKKSEVFTDASESDDVKEIAEDDDDLRRKVEEFIEKTNRRWKEEKLRAYRFELEIAVARS